MGKVREDNGDEAEEKAGAEEEAEEEEDEDERASTSEKKMVAKDQLFVTLLVCSSKVLVLYAISFERSGEGG